MKGVINLEKPTPQNSVEFKVYGKQALFTDVLTKVGGERCTYMIPTYEALKGIIHSIYWKPTIVWYIDSVRVMNPICTFRRGIRPIKYTGGNDLAYYTYLENVCYHVKAHFEWNLNRPELENDRSFQKHLAIAKRMIERGGRRDIFLGTRECQGYVEACEFNSGKGVYDDIPEIPYSLMYHGITYADEAVLDEDKGMMTVRFWQPVMKNGIIDFISPEECTIKRHIHKMPIKPFGVNTDNFEAVDETYSFSGGDEYELGK